MSPRTSSTEAIRVIKRQLLKVAFPQERDAGSGGYDNVIMVTSSMPGEGKTFVSLNLAMSFCAERDLYVLLIDGDGHRRSLGGLLGAKEDVGLVDILMDQHAAGERPDPADQYPQSFVSVRRTPAPAWGGIAGQQTIWPAYARYRGTLSRSDDHHRYAAGPGEYGSGGTVGPCRPDGGDR